MGRLHGMGYRSELLDVVTQIKSRARDNLGINDFPAPQFILVGKQSVGKSRMIECLAGEIFNFVSESLGSRRPTSIEIRLVPGYAISRWYMLDKRSSQWEELPLSVVMSRLESAHERLGENVSSEPVCIRVENDRCCDMQIVDLPGFREFALDDTKQRLAEQIEEIAMEYMKNRRNVMICVEEAGDAVNLATLARCRRVDPKFQRTILIRNKLDKYYRDLSPGNMDAWMSGSGNLPDSLPSFVLTLPNWKEGRVPANFADRRSELSQVDVAELRSRGASEAQLKKVGFTAFSTAMTERLEKMLGAAIDNILKELKVQLAQTGEKLDLVVSEMDTTNPNVLRGTIRQAGADFGDCLTHVMEGQLRLLANTMTLRDELEAFHEYHTTLASPFQLLPTTEFACLEDYLSCLENDVNVPTMDVEINGGAQFRRLMFEVEVFCRFSEIYVQSKKKDVVQARGVSVGTMTWREVVVKLLNSEAHLPMRDRVRYVGERIKWFFLQQKEVILEFMRGLKDSPDVHMYSQMYPATAHLLDNNEMVKTLIYNAYDKAVERQLGFFLNLFNCTLASTFSNPWVFVKKGSVNVATDDTDYDVSMPSFEETKARIPYELGLRSGIDNILERYIARIPSEPTYIDDAVEKAQLLCLEMFKFIRAQVSDQIELFAESFFKHKMLRRLGDDMRTIELSAAEMGMQDAKMDDLRNQQRELECTQVEIEECMDTLQRFVGRYSSGLA